MIQNFDNKFNKQIDQEDNNIKSEKKPNKFQPIEQNNKTFLNKKRKSKEEHEKEKNDKLQKRKSIYKKLNMKTPKGQPVMKYKVQHLLHKIKDKISKGII